MPADHIRGFVLAKGSIRATARRAPSGLALGAAVLAGAALAGCGVSERMTGASLAPVDPSSPVAQDVIRVSRVPGPYPTFADIPKIPTDVRPASAWRSSVQDEQRERAVLDAQVAALPPVTPGSTEQFAADARSRLAPPPADVPPADARQRAEAEAKALRERATPPPPPR